MEILGGRLRAGVRRGLTRYRFGPAAFKVDIALDGDIPWRNPDCGRAGTVHLGGGADEMVATEARVVRGELPERPFVLLGQQYLADPSRSAGGINPIYAYAHVPHAYSGDATEAVLAQIERFAPGFRDQVVAISARNAVGLADHNENYVGGDIATGANHARQILFRPRIAGNPYALGALRGSSRDDAVRAYLCSAATPPGAGVHGMGGFHAAEAALRHAGG